MISFRRGARTICCAAALWAPLAGRASGQGWARVGWQYRRQVTIDKFKPTRLDGYDVGVVTMPTGGLAKADCSDIRVVTGPGREVSHRVLMVGPGDRVRLAFAVFGGMTSYNVYFGNPKSSPPTKELEIRRGVLLEMWRYPGGSASRLADVQRMFERLEGGGRGRLRRRVTLLGRAFRQNVFLGHNPFGPEHNVASRFTAWLTAPRTGTYTFAASSRNACFLLVDDQLVVDFGGWHGPVRDIRKRNTVRLSAGLHKLTVYHVTTRGDPQVVAAWQAPGDKRIWTIPASAFAPVHRAAPGAIKKYGAAFTADFLPEHAGETFMMNRYFQRYRFRSVWSGQGGTRAKWKWDFGDGQTAQGSAAEHVYLLPGLYTVKVTATLGGRELSRTNRIYVSRPWDRVTKARLDSIRYHANVVSTYDFSTLSPEATAWAVKLFERTGKVTSILRAGSAFVRRKEAPADSIREVMPAYADQLVAGGKALQAVGALEKASQMTKNPAARAEVLVKAGQVCLLDKRNADQALAFFTRVIKRFSAVTRSPAIREARMGIGDVYRVKGDYEKASQEYKKAHVGPDAIGIRAPIMKGDFARHVEAYTRKRDYESAEDYLRKWEYTFPLDKLEGYWSLLKVRLRIAQRKYRQAVHEADVLIGVNPTSQYAPDLLMAAAEAYRRLRDMAKYTQTLQRLAKEYPESALSLKAAEMLKTRK